MADWLMMGSPVYTATIQALTCSSSELQSLLSIAVGELQRGADPASINRALEVLCCLVTKTAFKDELTFNSGRCQSCVPLIVRLVSLRTCN